MDLEDAGLIFPASPDRLVALDEALAKLAAEDAVTAELVKIRLFAGLSVEQAGAALGLSRATANRHPSLAASRPSGMRRHAKEKKVRNAIFWGKGILGRGIFVRQNRSLSRIAR